MVLEGVADGLGGGEGGGQVLEGEELRVGGGGVSMYVYHLYCNVYIDLCKVCYFVVYFIFYFYFIQFGEIMR